MDDWFYALMSYWWNALFSNPANHADWRMDIQIPALEWRGTSHAWRWFSHVWRCCRGQGCTGKIWSESVRASAQRFGETSTFVGSVAEIREREVRLYNDRIEAKDSVEKERVLETVDAVRQYAIDGVREIVGAFPVQCEKKITTRFRHCMVEIIGYIDLFVESPCKIIELKTVWDNSHRGMKQGWASKKLPARPSNAHVSQVSVYWKALTDKGKTLRCSLFMQEKADTWSIHKKTVNHCPKIAWWKICSKWEFKPSCGSPF